MNQGWLMSHSMRKSAYFQKAKLQISIFVKKNKSYARYIQILPVVSVAEQVGSIAWTLQDQKPRGQVFLWGGVYDIGLDIGQAQYPL